MKIHVGAGGRRLEGFENVDVRRAPGIRRGHAGNLSFAGDGAATLVYAHAVLEHVYPAHQVAVLREWRRVLAPGGAIVCLGIPDFETIAAAYLAGDPGVTGPHFDLFEAYRYTHGHPEHQTILAWPLWDPARRPDLAPAGYLPQLHKGLFDARFVSALLRQAGFTEALMLRYAFPTESATINLGFVAGDGCADQKVAEAQLEEVPALGSVVRRETVAWLALEPALADRMLAEIMALQYRPPRWRLLAGSIRRAARGWRAAV